MKRSWPDNFAFLLLTLVLIFQPVMSFAVTFPGQHFGALSGDQASSMEDCCLQEVSMCTAGQAGEQCQNMTLESCLLAISLGDCGLSGIFLPVAELRQVFQQEHDQPSIVLDCDYRSIVLDTLTPPPNTSIV